MDASYLTEFRKYQRMFGCCDTKSAEKGPTGPTGSPGGSTNLGSIPNNAILYKDTAGGFTGSSAFFVSTGTGEFVIDGKLNVTGMIDPTGVAFTPQTSHPLNPSDPFYNTTIWFKTDQGIQIGTSTIQTGASSGGVTGPTGSTGPTGQGFSDATFLNTSLLTKQPNGVTGAADLRFQFGGPPIPFSALAQGLTFPDFVIPAVHTLTFGLDGSLYVGGNFVTAKNETTEIPVNGIAKWNGVSWSALGGGFTSVMTPQCLAIATHPSNGTLYAGGIFDSADGVPNTNSIASWNGTTWLAMGTGLQGSPFVFAIAIASNGDVYVGGIFNSAGGISGTQNIAKWDGSTWSALGSGLNATCRALVIGPDGFLYAGGDFSNAGGSGANNLARWTGSAWVSVGASPNGTVSYLLFGPDDALYATGTFETVGGLTSVGKIAKCINPATSPTWSNLATGLNNSVSTIQFGSDGILYAGGSFTDIGGSFGNSILYVAKWNGSSWSSLQPGIGVSQGVFALAIQSNTLYIGGAFSSSVPSIPNTQSIVKYSIIEGENINNLFINGFANAKGYGLLPQTSIPQGAYSTTTLWYNSMTQNLMFGASNFSAGSTGPTGNGSMGPIGPTGLNGLTGPTGPAGGGSSFATIPDTAIVFKESGDSVTGSTGLAFIPGTTVSGEAGWTALSSGLDASCRAIAISGNSVLVGGEFTTAGGNPANRIAKWNPVSETWSALGSGLNGPVNAIAIYSDTEIYVGGNFTTAGGNPANYVAKWDGSSWSALGSGLNGECFALAKGPDGYLYVGGAFTTAGTNTNAGGIAYYNRSNSSWNLLGINGGFGGTGGGICKALVFSTAGVLYAGGQFSQVAGGAAKNIAAWNGSVWNASGSGLEGPGGGYCFALAAGQDGVIYAGGDFTTAGGSLANYVAKWDGSSWSALDEGFDALCNALTLDTNGILYAGGIFDIAGPNYVNVSKIAKLDTTNPSPTWAAINTGGVIGDCFALTVGPNASLYAGGQFNNTVSGVTVNKITRYNQATSLNPSNLYIAGYTNTFGIGLVPQTSAPTNTYSTTTLWYNDISDQLMFGVSTLKLNNSEVLANIYSTERQFISSATTTPITFDSHSALKGISYTAGTPTITVSKSAYYEIDYSAQLQLDPAIPNTNVYIWLVQNGSAIPDTNTLIELNSGLRNLNHQASYIQAFSVNDTLQFHAQAETLQAQFFTSTTTYGPRIPSFRVNIKEIV